MQFLAQPYPAAVGIVENLSLFVCVRAHVLHEHMCVSSFLCHCLPNKLINLK